MIRKAGKSRKRNLAKRRARFLKMDGGTGKLSEKSVKELVEQAFGQLNAEQSPIAQSFISLLYERFKNAEQATARVSATFIVCWALTYLVARGFIPEATVAGMKIIKIQSLLIFTPVALGYLSYRCNAALSSAMVLSDVIGEWYFKFLPKLKGTGLDTLLSSDAPFMGAEEHDVLTKHSGIESAWSWLMVAEVVLFAWPIPLIAIGHVGYMLWQMAQWSRVAVAIFTLIGIVLWLRGVSMTYSRVVTV